MNQQEKTYYAWLNNAYGQEICMAQMYTMHAKDVHKGLNAFPELENGLQKQSELALTQAERIRTCILRLTGKEPFAPKVVLGKTMGAFLGWTGDITVDKVIMNNLTDYGMINFEIAAYQTLIAGAESMNDPETEAVCREILKEEKAFAQWLETRVSSVAQEFLDRTGEG